MALRTAALQVTVDGQSQTLSAFTFLVHPQPVITKIAPTFGPADGGTLITVFGRDFQNDARPGNYTKGVCRFNSLSVPIVQFVDAFNVVCRAPSTVTSYMCTYSMSISIPIFYIRIHLYIQIDFHL